MNHSRLSPLLISSFLLLLALSIASCKQAPAEQETQALPDPYAHISDLQVKELLKHAIDAAGGLERWNSLQQIAFRKIYALYDIKGETETEVDQIYIQKNHTDVSSIENAASETPMLLYQLGPHAIQVRGDVNPDISEESKRNSMLSASFVISVPFNLLDTGAQLSYAGKDKMEDGTEVEVLQVVYDPDAHAHHSTPDTWWHYFDAKTYRQLGYMVQHADHFSFVENLELEEAGGILFPKRRDSWRVNEQREKLWLRAKYEYSEFHVK